MWNDQMAKVVLSLQRQGRHTVLFHQALAERVGLNASDSRTLAYLDEVETANAGDLSEMTGLTTGAVTRIIDRLEDRGFVRRAPDPKDRRKVLVVVERDSDAHREMTQLFSSFGSGVAQLLARYSGDELEVIRRFADEGTEVLKRETAKLQAIS